MLLIENVPQMLTHEGGRFRDEILICLRKLGYLAQAKILLASEYGVPQNRRRAFILGVREDIHRRFGFVAWPLKTHRRVDADSTLDMLDQFRPLVTVKEAIGDLPKASSVQRMLPYKRSVISEYAALMRKGSSGVTWHVARTPGERVLSRLNALTPGMRLDHLPHSLRTRSYYFNAYGRLCWDQPAKTITKSCNYLGSGCFGHPEIDRGITMREAARLQSFPDFYSFAGATENLVAKQVGGAVPPLLAQRIGEEIVRHLRRVNEGDMDAA
jgi:DNA (cytosine-5)-methyltransferase 1